MAPVNADSKIVIIGMGPCGLGAAWRLQELGYQNYKIFEARSSPGGLASSFLDEKGFTWDIGGHVQFSHYRYFDELMDFLLPQEWVYHERSSWGWLRGGFVPYPVQNNIHHLPKQEMWECLRGLIDIVKHPPPKPTNFREWITATFGEGIARYFMLPYNFKVWAHPPEMMTFSWLGERVAVVDLQRVAENIIFNKDDISWGPNNKFRFPLRGGTGMVWKKLYSKLDPNKMRLGTPVHHINTRDHFIEFSSGERESYDILVTTIPLDQLLMLSDLQNGGVVGKLLHSTVHIIGIGLRGQPPPILKDKCWIYFPEGDCPFYRVTVFSNYSPYNTPDHTQFWSLMAEVSESSYKPVNRETVVQEVIKGMLNTRLIESEKEIVDQWYHFEPYGYPIPSHSRDEALQVLRDLEERQVYSRGRFGAWKYEVSNQDHTCMQGVELVNRLLLGEEEITVWNPAKANAKV